MPLPYILLMVLPTYRCLLLYKPYQVYKVTFLVTGTPPINTVILSHSAVFVDTTNTSVAVQLEEGNFVCVATNKFGFDLRMFSVTFSGKRLNLK